MPLLKGAKAKSKKGVSENIKREMHAGKPQKQAIAIAMSEAGKSRPKKKAKKEMSHVSADRIAKHAKRSKKY